MSKRNPDPVTAIALGFVLLAVVVLAAARWRAAREPVEPVAAQSPAKVAVETPRVATVETTAPAAQPRAHRERPKLVLLSTAEAPDPAHSIATLLVVRTGDRRAARPGDEVVDGSVLEWVESGRAGLRLDDERWTLRLGARRLRTPGPGKNEDPESPAPGLDVDASTPGNHAILAMFREEPGQLNRVNLLSEAAIGFRFDEENGDILGMTLGSVSRNGVYAQLGIQSGDVLLSVNDIGIDGPEAAESALDEIEHKRRLRIVLQRAEQTREIVVKRSRGSRRRG